MESSNIQNVKKNLVHLCETRFLVRQVSVMLIYLDGSNAQPTVVGKSWRQELEAPGHIKAN